MYGIWFFFTLLIKKIPSSETSNFNSMISQHRKKMNRKIAEERNNSLKK